MCGWDVFIPQGLVSDLHQAYRTACAQGACLRRCYSSWLWVDMERHGVGDAEFFSAKG